MDDIGLIYRWLLSNGLQVLLVVIIAIIITSILRKFTVRAVEKLRGEKDLTDARKKRIDTLGRTSANLISLLIWVIAGFIILEEMNINLRSLLVGAGVVGVALGFGAQNLVRDYLNGLLILIENQYGVGDVIKIGDIAGLVESVNLRITTLRDVEGRVHIIPNGEIKIVTNLTKEYSWSLLDIGVAYKEDVDHVMKVLQSVGDELYGDEEFRPFLLEPIEILGVNDFAESQVTIRVRFKTLPIKQWAVGREFRRRIKKAFDREGIEIPFPHRTVYIGEGKQGSLPITRKE